MTTAAEDLPDGSIVADRDIVYIKNHPTQTAQWRGTNGGFFGDWYVQEKLLDSGKGEVVRVGRETVRREG